MDVSCMITADYLCMMCTIYVHRLVDVHHTVKLLELVCSVVCATAPACACIVVAFAGVWS